MKVSRLLLDALETFPNFVIIDKNANVVYLNESYAVLLGIQRDAAIGKPVQSAPCLEKSEKRSRRINDTF